MSKKFRKAKGRSMSKILIRTVSAAVITGAHIEKHKGLPSACTRCGEQKDDLNHRLFICPAANLTRNEFFRPSLARHKPVDTMEYATKYCALRPIPRKLLEEDKYTTTSSPAYPNQEMVDIADIFDEDFGAVYTDASGFFSTDLYFARTAMAIVQVDVTGIVRRAWATTISSLLSTHPGYGEQMAAFLYASTEPGGHIVTDCAAVVSNIDNTKHAAHPKTPLAGA